MKYRFLFNIFFSIEDNSVTASEPITEDPSSPEAEEMSTLGYLASTIATIFTSGKPSECLYLRRKLKREK